MVQTYAQRVRSRDKAKRERQKLKERNASFQKQLAADFERITEEQAFYANVLDEVERSKAKQFHESIEKFATRLRNDLRTSKHIPSFSFTTYINVANTQIFTTNFFTHKNNTKIRHPRQKYPPERTDDLTYSQIDKLLNVLGECYPPETWNFGRDG